ncbi:MAG TPA: hypothetical protein VGT05_05110 [Patescibacteria group bacterium]|nr:hypothetical protein [Patescibacteria group bacterium]
MPTLTKPSFKEAINTYPEYKQALIQALQTGNKNAARQIVSELGFTYTDVTDDIRTLTEQQTGTEENHREHSGHQPHYSNNQTQNPEQKSKNAAQTTPQIGFRDALKQVAKETKPGRALRMIQEQLEQNRQIEQQRKDFVKKGIDLRFYNSGERKVLNEKEIVAIEADAQRTGQKRVRLGRDEGGGIRILSGEELQTLRKQELFNPLDKKHVQQRLTEWAKRANEGFEKRQEQNPFVRLEHFLKEHKKFLAQQKELSKKGIVLLHENWQSSTSLEPWKIEQIETYAKAHNTRYITLDKEGTLVTQETILRRQRESLEKTVYGKTIKRVRQFRATIRKNRSIEQQRRELAKKGYDVQFHDINDRRLLEQEEITALETHAKQTGKTKLRIDKEGTVLSQETIQKRNRQELLNGLPFGQTAQKVLSLRQQRTAFMQRPPQTTTIVETPTIQAPIKKRKKGISFFNFYRNPLFYGPVLSILIWIIASLYVLFLASESGVQLPKYNPSTAVLATGNSDDIAVLAERLVNEINQYCFSSEYNGSGIITVSGIADPGNTTPEGSSNDCLRNIKDLGQYNNAIINWLHVNIDEGQVLQCAGFAQAISIATGHQLNNGSPAGAYDPDFPGYPAGTAGIPKQYYQWIPYAGGATNTTHQVMQNGDIVVFSGHIAINIHANPNNTRDFLVAEGNGYDHRALASQHYVYGGAAQNFGSPDLIVEGWLRPIRASTSITSVSPSTNICNNTQYQADISKLASSGQQAVNFGDPVCNFPPQQPVPLKNLDAYASFIRQEISQYDPLTCIGIDAIQCASVDHAKFFFNTIAAQETSGYDPNAYNPNSPAGGAYGLFQMSKQGSNANDNGYTNWQLQTKNAILYNDDLERSGHTWCYWQTARAWFFAIGKPLSC